MRLPRQSIDETEAVDVAVLPVPRKRKEASAMRANPYVVYGVGVIAVTVTLHLARYGLFHLRREAMIWDSVLDTIQLPMDEVPAVWKNDEFECLGWRATDGCNPWGTRLPADDKPCDSAIVEGMAGYCEVRNRTSGATYRTMASTCRAIMGGVSFHCNMAKDFTDFSKLAATYTHPVPVPLATPLSRGIVFSVYYGAMPGVVAIIHLLRAYGCVLPIELFYRADEIDADAHPLVQSLVGTDSLVSMREILDPHAVHFATKPYAVYHSAFDQVLLLDCDNIPLRDPTYLFESTAFLLHGAVFWPDFWQPRRSIFNIQPQSLLWQFLDMPYWDTFEQESAQVLVDRRRSQAPLQKLMAYALGVHGRGSFLQTLTLAYGDKDLFRLAWRNTSSAYHFVDHLPVFAGRWHALAWPRFCGLAMVQHDPDDGQKLFLHRNMVKLSGRPGQRPALTHLAPFTGIDKHLYRAECKGVHDGVLCWGFLWPSVPYAIEEIDVEIHTAEAAALAHAEAAWRLLGLPDDDDKEPVGTPPWADPIFPAWVVAVLVFAWYVGRRHWMMHVASTAKPRKHKA
ncbi:Aste57867_13215 [Aphanomyces stellatus]|uniref:Aste57867_13215 protein n=1 Tax=Aphanomyces stellatus TaxID=120398 RepID=A0A485KZL9_9STRA|nr:hypothetical protein As57867_013166 [Aphanomyces stellatus]VFT90055.1 Aste57867_13215 [Aphanomyces stellatus]